MNGPIYKMSRVQFSVLTNAGNQRDWFLTRPALPPGAGPW